MKKDYISYQVSLKLLLHHRGKVLILKTEENDIDLPGGRIEKGEERTLLKKLTEREIKEELGSSVRYKVKGSLFWYRGLSQYGCWVFVIVHEAEYLGGKIKLSKEHKSYEWINARKPNLKRGDFAAWDREKYLAFKGYFASK